MEDADAYAQPAADSAEVTAVSKQTTDTLMAGERIMEAIDLADAERAAFSLYEEAKVRLPEAEAEKVPPPNRNPVLQAHGCEPDEYVLMTIEKIHSAALMDALLVLPFGKMLSLMVYLSEWARKVFNSIRWLLYLI